MGTNQDILNLISDSKTAYQAVNNVKKILLENGYKEFNPKDVLKLKSGDKYFVTKNDSSLIAFVIGKEKKFLLSLAHTDSPCFKIKNNPNFNNEYYGKLNAEVYGGPIFSSWLDRPLGIAGRVFIKTKNGIEKKYFDSIKPITIIPNVCIHFNRDINNGYIYNKAVDLVPLISLTPDFDFYHYLSTQFHVDKNDILSFDLFLYNSEKPIILGDKNDFFSSPRIDNLLNVFALTQIFKDINNPSSTCVMALFDNEEIGSNTFQGAGGGFLENTLERISIGLNFSREDFLRSLSSSFVLNVDNAHAIHPNHSEFHDKVSIKMNEGIVIKHSASQTYASDGYSSSYFINILKENKIPYQIFYNRSDIKGGATLGNISILHVSVPTIDIGISELAMHSSYETCGLKDIDYLKKALICYFKN